MKRLALLVGCVAALARCPPRRSAHPLGNFTINRFSRDRGLRRPRLRPLRPRPGRDPDLPGSGDASTRALTRARIAARRAARRVDGRPARARSPLGHALAHPAGRRRPAHDAARGRLRGPRARRHEPRRLPRHELRRPDRLEGDRRRATGARRASSAATSVSDELRAYPKDLLQSPLDVTSRRARRRAGDGPARARRSRAARRSQAPDRVADGGFASADRARRPRRRRRSCSRSRSRSSGARRTRSRRATASRSSPRTSSASAARRGTRRCSG